MRALLRALALLAALFVGANTVPAQDEAPAAFDEVELRVTSMRPGGVAVIDRGRSDGVALGDRVTFRPREGGIVLGTIVAVADRTAQVELDDRTLELAVGTRGEVRVAALEDPVPEIEPEPEPAEPDDTVEPAEGEAEATEVPEHPPWENLDEKWDPDMALLAKVEVVRPEDREREIHARLYGSADHTWTSEDGRSDAFDRLGADLLYENPFGRGGGLSIDGEVSYRNTHVPDQDDENFYKLRIDRLSYYEGGTRFDQERWEAGRFLQHGIPEFGVVDGYEWTWRTREGHRYGGSLGFMPDNTVNMESGHDFQASGYYKWVSDESERFAAAAGFQKTWHNGAGDRNLIVTKAHYLPLDAWNYTGTLWIDLYSSSDVAKGSGVELTQALVSANRRWNDVYGANVTWSHIAYPETLAAFGSPISADQLANGHNDRISASGWTRMSDHVRVRAQTGIWFDEDEAGGNVELGVDVENMFLRDSTSDATLFATEGEFGTAVGARVGIGQFTDHGRWDLSYELSDQHQDDFNDNNDDLIQHWLRASHDFQFSSGWDLSVSADARVWDQEESWSVGVYFQKHF